MKKRLLALMLVVAMVMGMSVTAFADEATYADQETITITKYYNNETSNTYANSPAETLSFNIEAVSVTDAADGIDKNSHNLPQVSTISFEEGDAGKVVFANGEATYHCRRDITVTLPTYTSVGIYTYTINEVAGTMAGVEYYTDDITLVVTVIQDDTGKLRVAAVHTEEEGEDKSDVFVNKYYSGNLSIKKTVTGNLGDQTKDFTVTVTFTAPEGITVGAPIVCTDDGEDKTIAGNWTGTKTVIIDLKHDETVTFTNIPAGVTYKVVEDDYSKDGYDAPVYETTAQVYDDITIGGETISETTISNTEQTIGGDVAVKVGSNTIISESYFYDMEITNNKTSDVDTGIFTTNMPYILALVAIAAVAVVMFRRKREF